MYTTIYKLRGRLYKVAKTFFLIFIFIFLIFKSFNTTLLVFFKITYTRTDRFFFSQEALGYASSQEVLTSALHPSLHTSQLCMTEQTKQI